MATRRCLIGAATIAFFSLAITIPAVSASVHTVGEGAGWFFNLSSNATSVNYSDWAASQTFYLMDYITFKTTNLNFWWVVQTNNETTYNLCDASYDDLDNLTIRWNPVGYGDNMSEPLQLDILLDYEGSNYFFSYTNRDGRECQNGMKFGINVLHGNGGGGPSQGQSSRKSGVEGMQGGMVWTGLVLLSLGLMAV